MAIDLDRMASAGRTIIQRAPLVPRGVFAAVGMGVAFGVGILIGGSGDAHAVDVEKGQDALAIAASRSDVLEETRARLKLTYANELVKPEIAEPRRAPPARAVPVKEEVAAAPIEAPPAPLVEAPAVPAVSERAVGKPEEPTPGSERDEDVEKRSGADLKAALARVVDDVKPVARFSLQVAAAPTQAGADEVARKLGGQGHNARVVEGQVGGKPVFRVRVGGFGDRAQADAYKAKLAMPAFIVNE